MKLDHLSASRIKTFEQCELKYHAKYDLGLRDKPHPLTLMGSALHKMFEKATLAILNDEDEERKQPRFWMDECCKKYHVSLQNRSLLSSLANNAVQWGYFRKIAATKGCEVKFDFALADNTKVIGFIDRLDVEPPRADVLDLKTQKSEFLDAELRTDWQSRVYNIAARELYPEVTEGVSISFWVLRHRVQRVWMHLHHAEKDKEELMRVADKIRSCEDPKPCPSKLCRWCPLYGECEAGLSVA